jgi:hypothetical protein
MALASGLVALAWSASGCISPKDDYKDFSSRPITEREASVVDVEMTQCQKLLGENLSGLFYTSCLPKANGAPFALATTQTITPSEDATSATLEMSFTPLKLFPTSMSDTTGAATVLPKTTIDSNCAYTLNIGTLTLGKDANALNRDLTATNVVLRGIIQNVDRACAELDGQVDLIMLSLMEDGDHCIFVRAPADNSVPEVTDWPCDNSQLHPRGTRF